MKKAKTSLVPFKNERTSKRVSKIAGRILKDLADLKRGGVKEIYKCRVDDVDICTVSELEALAASCLTQTED